MHGQKKSMPVMVTTYILLLSFLINGATVAADAYTNIFGSGTENSSDNSERITDQTQQYAADASLSYITSDIPDFTEGSAITGNGNYTEGTDTLVAVDSGIEQDAASGEYRIKNAAGFLTLAKYSNAHDTAGFTFVLDFSSESGLAVTVELDSEFPGIGSPGFPFRGTLKASFPYTLRLNGCAALFRYLSSDAVLSFGSNTGITIESGATAPYGLLAQVLVVNNDAMTVHDITLRGNVENAFTSSDHMSDTGALFGRIEKGTAYVDNTFTLNIPSVSTLLPSLASGANTVLKANQKGDAGGLIGKLDFYGTINISVSSETSDIYSRYVTAVCGNAGGMIGSVTAQTAVNVSYTGAELLTVSGDVTANHGHAGALVGDALGGFTLANRSSLTAGGAVTAKPGNAGGVAGNLTSSLVLPESFTVNAASIVAYKQTDGGDAGGLVGFVGETAAVTVPNKAVCRVSQEIGGGNSAGGVFGTLKSVSVPTVVSTVTATIQSDGSIGGVIGVLSLSDTVLTDSVSLTAEDTSVLLQPLSESSDCGGVIGVADMGNIKNSLILTGSVTSQLTNTEKAANYGGIVGKISESTYCRLNDLAVVYEGNYSEAAKEAAAISEIMAGAVADVGNVLVQNNASSNQSTRLICKTGIQSIVRLNGTVDFSACSNYSGIVYTQDSSLIYADDGFALSGVTVSNVKRDDIGNYGQIYRNSAIGNIISFSDSDHTAFVAAITPADQIITIASVTDFAKLSIFLSSKGNFGGVNSLTSANYFDLSQYTISFSNDIDLTGTGIESLTRTDSSSETVALKEIQGNGKTVTLAIGETYPYDHSLNQGTTNHQNLGLFANVAGTVTVNRLNIAGGIRICGNMASASYINVGGFAAQAAGALAFSECKTTVTMTVGIQSDSKDKLNCFGGWIGSFTGSSLKMTDSVIDPDITFSSNGNIGGAIAFVKEGCASLDFSGTTVSGSIIAAKALDNARCGGLIAQICQYSSDLISKVGNTLTKVDLNEVTVSDAVLNVNASSATGGLLGYCWFNVDADLYATVKNNTYTLTGNTNYGGLFYRVTGRMTVQDGTTVSGTFPGAKIQNNASDGIFVCHGEYLYFVMKAGSEAVEKVVIGALRGGSLNYVDRLVGVNIREKNNDVAVYGGIVTIEVPSSEVGKMPAEENGWYAVSDNPNTRYYYNIDALSASDNIYKKNGAISAPQDLLLWHLCRYTNGKFPAYFNSVTTNELTADNDVNMTDFCLYPTTVDAPVTINFGFHTLTLGLTSATAVSKTADKQTQNYMLQTGLFYNVGSDLSVSNMTMAGTVYPWMNGTAEKGAGALIVGTLQGDAVNKQSAVLTLTNITLNGLKVNSVGAYAPLLINNVSSYATATVTGIEMIGYTNGTAVATSLMGNIGNETASSLNFSFTQLKLIDRNMENGGVFKNAILFEALDYASGEGNFAYNFTFEDDENDTVTYGYELTEKGTLYLNDTRFVYPDDVSLPDYSNVYNFTERYQKYIAHISNSAVLEINKQVGNLDIGYGTYKRPYVITDAYQLLTMATFVNSGGTVCPEGWTINYLNGAEESTLIAPFSETAKAALLSWVKGAYYLIQPETANDEKVLQIADNTFFGIGTASNPFHGVIDGGGSTLEMPDDYAAGLTGLGLVAYANGCLIQNLNIKYSGTYEMSDKSASGSETISFGGVIANAVGGDNIIDKVAVSGIAGITVQNISATNVGGYVGLVIGGTVAFRRIEAERLSVLAADESYFYVAPYIGRVVNGTAFSVGNQLDNTQKNFYIPCLSGQTDGDTSVFSPSQGKIAVSNKTFTVTSAEQLLILSMVINSEAFAVSFGGSYSGNSPVSRKLSTDYSKIGTGFGADTSENSSDDFVSDIVPYLVSQYCSDSGVKTYISSGSRTSCSVTLSANGDYDLSGYHNGFRGLGGMYVEKEKTLLDGAFDATMPLFSNVNGNGAKISYDLQISQYVRNDPYETISVGFIPAIFVESGTLQIQKMTLSGTVSLKGYNIDGTLSKEGLLPEEYDSNKSQTNCNYSTGGLIGRINDKDTSSVTVRITDIALSSMCVYSQNYAGGVIGYAYDKYSKIMTVEISGCYYENSTVTAQIKAGGIIAFIRAAKITIRGNDKELSDSLIMVDREKKADSDFKTDTSGRRLYDIGVGGIIGMLYGHNAQTDRSKWLVSIEKYNMRQVTVIYQNSDGSGNTGNNISAYGIGGMIGVADWLAITVSSVTQTDVNVLTLYGNISLSEVTHEIKIKLTSQSGVPAEAAKNHIGYYSIESAVSELSYYINAGSVIGSYGYQNNGTADGNNKPRSLIISDITVNSSADNNAFILSPGNSGGLIGSYTNYSTAAIKTENCQIGSGVCVIGGMRAGGVLAFYEGGSSKPTLTFSGTTVTDVILRAPCYKNAAAGGMIGENASSGSLTIEKGAYNISAVTNSAVFAAANAGGICGKLLGAAYINTTEVTGTAVQAGTDSAYVGGVAGTVSGTLYGNYILWKNDVLSVNQSVIADHVGAWVGKAGSGNTVQLLAVSRTDTSNTAYRPIASEATLSSKHKILYAAYGAESAAAIKEHPDVSVGSASVTGEHFGNNAVFLNGTEKPSWWSASSISLETLTNVGALSANKSGLSSEVLNGLPIITLEGKTPNDILPGYLNLLTNNGFGTWSDVSSSACTVEALQTSSVSISATGKGSVIYNGKKFEFYNYYDSVASDKLSFTLLTISFTNPSGADASNETYQTQLLICYPQVLQVWTYMATADHEEYNMTTLSSMTFGNQTHITDEKILTAYFEIRYSEVRKDNECALKKYIVMNLDAEIKSAYPKGAVLTLIDLNEGANKYTAYRYVIGDAAGDAKEVRIDLKDFTSVSGDSIAYLNMNALGEDGIEKFLLTVDLPNEFMSDDKTVNRWQIGTEIETVNNITLEINTPDESYTDKYAQSDVWLWDDARIGFEPTTSETNQTQISMTQNAVIYFKPTVQYPVYGERPYNNYVKDFLKDYAVFRFTLKNAEEIVMLPAGTKITVYDDAGNPQSGVIYHNQEGYIEFIVETAENEKRNILKESDLPEYHIQFDFSDVSPSAFESAFGSDNAQFTLTTDFYLTSDFNNPRSGYLTTQNSQLNFTQTNKVNVVLMPTDSLYLGINVSDQDDVTNNGKIAFDMTIDLSKYQNAGYVLDSYKVNFYLIKKSQDQSQSDRYSVRLTQEELREVASITLNDSPLEGEANSFVLSGENIGSNSNITEKLMLVINKSTIDFSNYMLLAELNAKFAKDGGAAENLQVEDQFIFTVAKIKTKID